ncbi:MAG TPA: hypothetical protein VGP33_07825, partial [Chloroflexota bacterium]|nr:hypothetical protein [Chloroflexota bacterium]
GQQQGDDRQEGDFVVDPTGGQVNEDTQGDYGSGSRKQVERLQTQVGQVVLPITATARKSGQMARPGAPRQQGMHPRVSFTVTRMERRAAQRRAIAGAPHATLAANNYHDRLQELWRQVIRLFSLPAD